MSTLIGACVREQRGLFRTHNESLRPDELLSSEDWKFGREGRSYNNPIYPSCRGMTPRCEEAPCYTVEPSSPLSFRNKQKKWIRNFNFVETHPFPEGVAEILADECDRHGLKFLRICGCGDLTAKLVAAVNALVELRPTRPIWVSTRIPELAAQLSRDAENLYLMVTSDASRRGRACWDRMKEENHPRAFNAFLMTRPDDEPGPEARVIFPARGVEGLPFIEGVTCPADHPAAPLDLKGACAKCGRCWGPGALDGSRHERPRQVATPPGAANSTTRKGPPKPVAGLKGTSPDAREDGASVREALALIHHLDGLVAGAGVAPESLQPLTDGIEVVQQRLAERLRKENTR